MAAFDTAITPAASSPSDTNLATLFTASADTAVMVSMVNIDGATSPLARVGIVPSGGSVHYKVYDLPITPGDGYDAGPYILQNGDAVQVRTSMAPVRPSIFIGCSPSMGVEIPVLPPSWTTPLTPTPQPRAPHAASFPRPRTAVE